ncbi:MAG: ATP-binding protein [Pseudomonadota bacterium]|nr:ATP-binding protein [Pseudomonadota bacterium]
MTGTLTDHPAQLAAEALPFPLLVFSDLKRVLWLNTAAQEWLGLSLKRLSKDGVEALHPAYAQITEPVFQAIDTGHSVIVRDAEIAGSRYDLSASYDHQAGTTTLSVLPSAPARRQEHQAALGFGRMLAHELKNPLASIRGAAQLLERTVPEPDRDLPETIIEDVDRITSLANRWSSIGDVELQADEPVNLNRVCVEALERLERGTNIGAGMITEQFDPSLPQGRGDALLLQQVVLNLLQNALDALVEQAEPRIRVETYYDALDRGVEGARPTPLVIAIRDNGPGVAPDLRASLFTPFVTSKPAGEGLGLSFCARIAQLHGGRLDFETREGATAFYLKLPADRRGTHGR